MRTHFMQIKNICSKRIMILLFLCCSVLYAQAQNSDNETIAYKYVSSVYPYVTKHILQCMTYNRIYTYVDQNVCINKYVGDEYVLYTYVLAGEDVEHQIVVSGTSIDKRTEHFHRNPEAVPHTLKPTKKTKLIAGQKVQKYIWRLGNAKNGGNFIIWISALDCTPPMDVPDNLGLHKLIMAEQYKNNSKQIISITTQYVITPELLQACRENSINNTDIDEIFKE